MAACAAYVPACGQSPPGPDEEATTSGAATQATTVTGRSASPASAGASVEGTVTLLTGDRVIVTRSGSQPLVRIEPGVGRTRIAFAMAIHGDSIDVIPSDVAHLVGGSLDRALFDVGVLLAEGHGDDRRADLPLIVTGVDAPPSAHASLAASGLVVQRAIPAVHAVAMRQSKASPGAALAQLTAGRALARTAAQPKIWLDRLYQPVLDRSVPQ
ncbi:MAG: hypothetical protein ACRDMZ_11890, partial [Solirubrobacteraceae bacterium]